MRILIVLFVFVLSGLTAFGQNEQAPIVERQVAYKDWTYKSVRDDRPINLREFARDKKLVMVVYFAPWCPNWRFDAPMLERLYAKYKAHGLGIIAVGEYDPVATMKTSLETLKVTFPAVYESTSRDDKQKTLHYNYRRSTGDARGWGSPWYIFLTQPLVANKGDVITERTSVVNGELIADEGEAFIRKRLGLTAEPKSETLVGAKIEACDSEGNPRALIKPWLD